MMIINKFINKEIKWEDIEYTSNFFLLVISLFSSYLVYNNLQLHYFSYVIFLYFMSDALCIPYERKKDILYHHVSSCIIIMYYFIYLRNYYDNNYVLHVHLQTEYSSIFLSTNYFLNYFKKMNEKNKRNNKTINTCYNISNICFMITFFRYRIYQFIYYTVINNERYLQHLEYYNASSFQKYYLYMTIISPILLNLYWGFSIVKIIRKLINKQKK